MLNLLKKSSFFIALTILVVLFLIFTRDATEEQETILDLQAVSSTEDPFDKQAEAIQDSNTAAVVDIKGAIAKPGVYEVSPDARVNDVILTAGGFTSDADQSQINLAQKVQDEMIIIVPKIGDEIESGAGSVESNGKIKVNMATQEEIEQLPGIGPAKAQAIIQHREEHGLFNSIEDLLNVSGIGQKTLENMQDTIQIP
ncbi:helix-hairpin-helix domain-containing protein [Oceanobacillus profundus]|uniref:helix-hairpin-helix domain-containing protein n=1 Tax=Oceanobacillus TaxID=182709 RepID=UPI0026E2AE2B|nr:helix-hairpin-helix domain-containing protein [Oceanobacillus profundus]MBR3120202.1 helix-hairpin-helix domain-containing protein [Oceanobacillus sp.]MDO6448183.1 helix-hairpin-helix domain-containing protein [Oceanobacillus profundus]